RIVSTVQNALRRHEVSWGGRGASADDRRARHGAGRSEASQSDERALGGPMQHRMTIRTFRSRVRTRTCNGSASRASLALLLGLGCYTPASAHCIVGNRFFPATLNVDDPC